jgi:hypothetical protein
MLAERLQRRDPAPRRCSGAQPRLERVEAEDAQKNRLVELEQRPCSRRIAQLAIVDALIACLALTTYDKAVETIGRTFDVLSTKRVWPLPLPGGHRQENPRDDL